MNNPYIKVAIDTGDTGDTGGTNTKIGGLNGFFPANKIISIMANNRKIYYIVPKLEDGVQKMITHTASFGVVNSKPGRVSANHCQFGSSILIYDLEICTDEIQCVKSLFFQNIK